MATILLRYVAVGLRGVFERGEGVSDTAWRRLRALALEANRDGQFGDAVIDLSWRHALQVLRSMSGLQESLGFEFDTDASSETHVQRFMDEYRTVRRAANSLHLQISEKDVIERLQLCGWNTTHHGLKPYQIENVRALLSLQNGANFSVPGAGKTTVTFAMHLLASEADKLLVVAPRNAFMAWEEVIDECLLADAPEGAKERFVQLVNGEASILDALQTNPKRLLITYGQLIRVVPLIEDLLSRQRVHLVLDEAHRMKAGSGSRSGTALLRLASLAMRRDILTGTPMPQRPADIQSQLDFLWPGSGLGARISSGENPRQVLGQLYVRTTKQQLGLEPRTRVPVRVTLSRAHLAFYSVLVQDVHAQASELRRGKSGFALIKARRSVFRLLLAAVNPQLLAGEFAELLAPDHAALLHEVLTEGPSARICAAANLARSLAAEGKKVLVWTNFRTTLHELRRLLQDLEPAIIDGSTTVGEEADAATRQGQILRFKTDLRCQVMIANPAAASEGMSLHQVCHDAIYLDRSYNATHFLQSVDRIHRLGLPPGTETRVHVLENKLPADVGSIDTSVARRLGAKIRAMEQLLGDSDLHELALDEEAMGASLDASIDWRDVEDLLTEIERPEVSGNEADLC
jgi:hypothetical protein